MTDYPEFDENMSGVMLNVVFTLWKAGDVCELVRVALRDHASPVSKIVAIALKFLKKSNPNLRLVVSFADTVQGHHGGIYQAGNWIYTGLTEGDREFHVKGEILHPRTLHDRGWRQIESWLQQNVDPMARLVKTPGKHRYLMPLDDEMRKQILPLSKPYPKRVSSADNGTAGDQLARGGVIPTDTLQHSGATA
jgi:hypothetical protein